MATITGTSGNNNLVGTGSDDIISGLAGNDTINSGLGIDSVDGGDGSDRLTIDYSSNTYTSTVFPTAGITSFIFSNGAGGWNGNLSAYTNSSASFDSVNFSNIETFNITGTITNDTIDQGGFGVFTVDGGAGIDTINNADFSSSTSGLTINNSGGTITQPNGTVVKNVEQFKNLTTGSGNDTITFTDNLVHSLNTGAGNDTIKLGGGDDLIDAGNGDDTINSGRGSDSVNGGAGSDRLVIDYSTNTYSGTVNFPAGIGSNVSGDGLGGFFGGFFAFTNNSGNADSVNFSNIETFQITGTGSNDVISTGSGSDILTGGAGNDTLNGGNGTDTVIESANVNFTLTNTTLTGLGTDTLISIEAVTLFGGAGNNTLNASAFSLGSVQLFGGDGNDTLTGGTGNDYLDGGVGNDTLRGGNGNDFIYDAGYGTGSNFLYGESGDDTLTAGEGIDHLDGGTGNDILKGGGGNDFLTGGLGNDTLNGENGTDTVIESGDVSFTLTNTTLTGLGTDTLISIEAVNLTGGAGNNSLNAGSFGLGSVTLNGGAGNDSIAGGSKSDILLGGDGNDTIRSGLGSDTVNGGNGTDIVKESGNINFTLTNTSLIGNGTDALISIESANLTGGLGDNILSTSAFTLGSVTLTGDAGNDTLKGGFKNDILFGGEGNDILRGAGNNNGVASIDTLTGGNGNDTFNLSNDTSLFYNDGNNATSGLGDYALIKDFSSTLDKIQLEGAANLYVLGASPIAGISGTSIFLDTNNNGTFNSTDELIAVLQGASGLNLASSYFTYV